MLDNNLIIINPRQLSASEAEAETAGVGGGGGGLIGLIKEEEGVDYCFGDCLNLNRCYSFSGDLPVTVEDFL